LPSKPDRVVHAKPVVYKNFDVPQPALLRNTGSALEIELKGDKPPIQWGIYSHEKSRYKMFKIIIHWGKENNKGAEHSIGGEQFAAELQSLKYNADKYKSPEQALGKPGGILIGSTVLKASKKSSNSDWDLFVRQAAECSGTSKPVKFELDPKMFDKFEGRDYYMYEGSLTTPPCSEKVLHVVDKEPLFISEEVLEALRHLKSESGEDMCDNLRPIQPLNRRKVTLVKVNEDHHDHEDEHHEVKWYGTVHRDNWDVEDNSGRGDHHSNDRFMDEDSGRRDYHSNDRFMDENSGRRDYHSKDRLMDENSGRRDYHSNNRFMDHHSGRRDYHSKDRFMEDNSGGRDYHRYDQFMDGNSGRRDYHRYDRLMDDNYGRGDYHSNDIMDDRDYKNGHNDEDENYRQEFDQYRFRPMEDGHDRYRFIMEDSKDRSRPRGGYPVMS